MLLATSLAGASASTVFLIIALVLLAIAAFFNPRPAPEPRWYTRISWGWAGMFCFVLSLALK